MQDACSSPELLEPSTGFPGFPRVLLYDIHSFRLAAAGVTPLLAAEVKRRGIAAEWVIAGSPAYGLREAAAEVPSLASHFQASAVVVFMSQDSLLSSYLYRKSRSYSPLWRYFAYEKTRWQAFVLGADLSPQWMEEALREGEESLSALRGEMHNRGILLFVLADGNVRQWEGERELCHLLDPFCSLFMRLARRRTVMQAEFLAPRANQMGVDFRTDPAIGEAMRAAKPDAKRIANLLAIAISPHLAKLAKVNR